jgi:eukaryotic-like serine/threonine-protein kinase
VSRSKTVGKYRIVGPLGHGGMSTVYKAVDEMLDREVAIKVLHFNLVKPGAITRFCAEATTLAKLNHPAIATIYDLFESASALLLVMELVRGETLESICGREPALPATSAASLADKILSALDHAHRAGVVHCDIKPANVMVTESGGIKIMDFGTARVRGIKPGTVNGYAVGTPAYMAPEQVLGRDVDQRTDLYAVGVVLYRLLTAKLPFDADRALAVAQLHLTQEPTPLHAHRQGLPDWCETILQRALAKSPGDRFQTTEEFREALRSATGMTAVELSQAFTISVRVPEMPPRSSPMTRTRVWSAAALRAAASTAGPGESGRTAPMFRAIVKRRSTQVLPDTRRAFLAGSLAAILVAGLAVLAIVPLRRPAVAAVPADSLRLAPAPVVVDASATASKGKRQRGARVRRTRNERIASAISGQVETSPPAIPSRETPAPGR